MTNSEQSRPTRAYNMTWNRSSQVSFFNPLIFLWKDFNPLTTFTAQFPSYEILYDNTQNISSQDYMYIVSLMLFHSCISCNNKFFQRCCESLDSKLQSTVAKFFGSLRQSLESKEPITKEVLRSAVKEAVMSPPSIRFISSSPLKTPDKAPSTPNKLLIQERLKEVQKLKTLLDNERYERNMLDAEVKQFEDKIDLLGKFDGVES